MYWWTRVVVVCGTRSMFRLPQSNYKLSRIERMEKKTNISTVLNSPVLQRQQLTQTNREWVVLPSNGVAVAAEHCNQANTLHILSFHSHLRSATLQPMHMLSHFHSPNSNANSNKQQAIIDLKLTRFIWTKTLRFKHGWVWWLWFGGDFEWDCLNCFPLFFWELSVNIWSKMK